MSGSTQTWQRFTTQAAAQAYCDQQTALLGLPAGEITQVWAVPQALTDGTYVVLEYRHTVGAAWDAAWVFALQQ